MQTMNKSTSSRLTRRGIRGWGRGQAMVETAGTMLVFLTVLFAIIEFAYALYCYDLVSYASKIGTRYAIVHGANSGSPAQSSDVQTFIASQIAGLDPSQITVNATYSPDNKPGSTVNVQVKYNFQFIQALIPHQALTLAAQAQG